MGDSTETVETDASAEEALGNSFHAVLPGSVPVHGDVPVAGTAHCRENEEETAFGDGPVKNELNARAAYYGAKVRGSGADRTAKSVMWSYGKKPWVRIQGDGATLGNAFGNVMSNRNGQLTLYSAQRNQPKFPLLKSLELSNEGTMGSLLKGKFTFVMYPTITNSGFVMGQVENAFFTPGKEVSIRWGWSVYASNAGACTGFMRGIIYNFNWSVNPDLSIVADCQVVSAATVAAGKAGSAKSLSITDAKFEPANGWPRTVTAVDGGVPC